MFSRGLLTFVFEFILANKWPGNSLCRDVNSCDTNCTVGQTEPCGCTCLIDAYDMDDDEVGQHLYSLDVPRRSGFGMRACGLIDWSHPHDRLRLRC